MYKEIYQSQTCFIGLNIIMHKVSYPLQYYSLTLFYIIL